MMKKPFWDCKRPETLSEDLHLILLYSSEIVKAIERCKSTKTARQNMLEDTKTLLDYLSEGE